MTILSTGDFIKSNVTLESFLVHLGMFAKYWQLGKVKTRLAQSLGDHLTREIYLVFVQHLIERFAQTANSRSIVYSPANRKSEFLSIADNWDLVPQSEGDLGLRMANFFQTKLSDYETENCVIVIGSDTPNLPVEYIERTSRLLEDNDVVIGPSTDGGYYLIAMSRFVDLFNDMPWSTDEVLPKTLNRLKESNTNFALLPELTDIDQEADLIELIAKIKPGASEYVSTQDDRKLFDKLHRTLADSDLERRFQ